MFEGLNGLALCQWHAKVFAWELECMQKLDTVGLSLVAYNFLMGGSQILYSFATWIKTVFLSTAVKKLSGSLKHTVPWMSSGCMKNLREVPKFCTVC